MTWNLIKRSDLYKAEETVLQKPQSGGDVRIALGYPNVYEVGMSNLGLQVVYSILNSIPGVVCERFFLPSQAELEMYGQSGRRLFTMESQRPVSEFQIAAFTVAFEPDYVNIAKMLELAGIPLRSEDRSAEGCPLVLAGGAVSLLNPEPIADFLDVMCIGEAEDFLPQFIERFRSFTNGSRKDLLSQFADLPGAYIPSFWQPVYKEGRFCGCIPRSGCPDNKISRLHLSAERYAETVQSSKFLTENTELGRSGLIEISRGCAFACRFCTVGFSYPKIRWKPLESVWKSIEELHKFTDRVGLISATAGTYPHIDELCRRLIESGISVAFSSLRVNSLPDSMLKALAAGGSKTVTLAPEVGSDALRRVANKLFTDAQYLETAGRAFEAGLVNLRMYSMIGLPGEREEHLQALADLARDSRKLQVSLGRGAGRITLSTGQLIPKPFTPFQWLAMLDKNTASKRMRFLEKAVSRIGGVDFACESPKLAAVQGLLARGDRRLGRVIELVYNRPSFGNWTKACREAGVDLEYELYEERSPEDAVFPWQHLTPEGSFAGLKREEAAAMKTAAGI